MPITARDIHEKEFAHAMRGYKESEVDDFLDLCAAEVDRLSRENSTLKTALEQERRATVSMGAQVAAPVVEMAEVTEVRVSHASAQEIGDVLLLAQTTADELVSKAHAQADKILSAAEGRASEIVGEAATRKRDIIDMAKVLKQAEVDFRNEYRALLEQKLSDIREITMAINMDADDIFIAPDEPPVAPRTTEAVLEPVVEPVVEAVAEEIASDPAQFVPFAQEAAQEKKVVEPTPIDPGILEKTSFIDQVEFDDYEIEEID